MDFPEFLTPGVIRALVAGVALLLSFMVLRRLFGGRSKADPHTTKVACACGWKGEVSRYKPRCPSCGKPIP